MAHPIQATPKLNCDETISFVNRLWNEQEKKQVINLSEFVKSVKDKRGDAGDSTKK